MDNIAPEPPEAMTALAAMMVDAGCLAVVGLMENGPGVLMVDDRTEPSEVATALRQYADVIEGLTDADMVGRVDVEVEDK